MNNQWLTMEFADIEMGACKKCPSHIQSLEVNSKTNDGIHSLSVVSGNDGPEEELLFQWIRTLRNNYPMKLCMRQILRIYPILGINVLFQFTSAMILNFTKYYSKENRKIITKSKYFYSYFYSYFA